jgi:hypothetical protein
LRKKRREIEDRFESKKKKKKLTDLFLVSRDNKSNARRIRSSYEALP